MIFVHQLAGLDHEECMHERKKIAQSLGSSEFVLEGSNGALEPFVTVLAVTKTVTSSVVGWGFSEKTGRFGQKPYDQTIEINEYFRNDWCE
ncbi:MAG: hypothetical protein ACO3S0_08255 [bacterium]|jgi:hypothetical protein